MNRANQQTFAESTLFAAEKSEAESTRRAGWASVAGILTALGAASCCVVPFALFTLGVSGAWISNLTMLEPYQPCFIALTVGCLGYGFYHVYRKPKVACADGSYCANPKSGRIAKIGLWTATALVIVAIAFPKLAVLFL